MSARPVAADVATLAAGVHAGDRTLLGRAITLVESRNPDHRRTAEALLENLAPDTGGAYRVAVTGVPGVGKSTFIEALGCWLIERGHRVGVLAVDPTSDRSRGSILGDKTRMVELARSDRAFVRPSPSGGAAGGVAARTREAMLILEAGGFDVVLVETVGVGQSETLVAGMVDFVLLLTLTGGGDELQGIKRGILELAHLVVVHKADGANREAAQRARSELEAALRYVRPADQPWPLTVLMASALEGTGLAEAWAAIEGHHQALDDAGLLAAKRRRQQLDWLWALLDEGLHAAFREQPGVAAALPAAEEAVLSGRQTPARVARRLLDTFLASDGAP